LQAEANAKEGNSAADGFEQWSTQIALIDGANECAEVADAREQKRFGLRDAVGGCGANCFGSKFVQGALD
jgi:hypothetical protein